MMNVVDGINIGIITREVNPKDHLRWLIINSEVVRSASNIRINAKILLKNQQVPNFC